MKPKSARRTASSASGPGVERGPYSPLTNATTTPICSARSARREAWERRWRSLPYHFFTSMKSRATSPRALMRCCCSTAPDGILPASSTCPPISRRSSCRRAPRAQPGRNVWQYLRQNWISNTVFENYDAIVDAACDAWRRLIADPEKITSIGMRGWAHVGQSL